MGEIFFGEEEDSEFDFDEMSLTFSYEQFHGCCGMIVVHDFLLLYGNRKALKREDVEKCREQWNALLTEGKGVDRLVATTIIKTAVIRNTLEREEVLLNQLLSKSGWKKDRDFVNPQTGNTVRVWKFVRKVAKQSKR
jgi:hypothetical protein